MYAERECGVVFSAVQTLVENEFSVTLKKIRIDIIPYSELLKNAE